MPRAMDKAHAEPRIQLLLASIYSAKKDYSTAAGHYRAYLKLVPSWSSYGTREDQAS